MFAKSSNSLKASYRYLLSFGSNLGDRRENCQRGLEALSSFCQIHKQSPLIETKPLKRSDYPSLSENNYLNMVCDVESKKGPKEFYKNIALIEDKIGHSRERKWLPRELDIDILLWAHNSSEHLAHCQLLAFHDNSLIIPHEGFLERDFLLELSERSFGLSASHLISENLVVLEG